MEHFPGRVINWLYDVIARTSIPASARAPTKGTEIKWSSFSLASPILARRAVEFGNVAPQISIIWGTELGRKERRASWTKGRNVKATTNLDARGTARPKRDSLQMQSRDHTLPLSFPHGRDACQIPGLSVSRVAGGQVFGDWSSGISGI